MTIEKISKEEFDSLQIHGGGRGVLPETTALLNLDVGQAMKFPCHWKHHGEVKSKCNGTITMYAAARRASMVIKATCRDGTVYVMRGA